MGVRDALEKYSKKHSGIKRQRQKKTKEEISPEKKVEKEIVSWCERHGWSISVVESKAVYSRGAGRYLRGQTEAGFSDLVGTDGNGYAVFIELKAKGKRNTLRPAQFDFLRKRISTNAFCACVDSSDLLHTIYSNWLIMKEESNERAQQYLLEMLPKYSAFLKEEQNELKW